MPYLIYHQYFQEIWQSNRKVNIMTLVMNSGKTQFGNKYLCIENRKQIGVGHLTSG